MRGVDTFLAIKAQADFDTPRALGDLASGDYLAFNSEGLTGRQTVINSPAIRRQAMRNKAFSAAGTVDSQGSVEFTASNVILDKLLPLIFHSKTGTADAVAGTGATYAFTDGGVLTPFTTFVGFNGPEGIFTRRFVSCKVNQATFQARVDQLLNVNLDIVGVKKEILTGTATPVYVGSNVEYGYVFSNAKVTIKAGDMSDIGELPVESFDLTINHNLSRDRYRLGSVYRRSLQEGITEVTGSFSLGAFDTSISGEVFDLGGGATHDPAFLERIALDGVYAALTFEVTDPSTQINSEDCTLKFTLPFVRLDEPGFNVSGPDIITGSSNFTAYDSLTALHIATLS